MLEVIKKSKSRVDIVLDGKLDTDDMRSGLDELLEQSEDVKNGVMLYKIKEFALPSLGAIGVEFARLPKLFGLLGRFNKCAVMTDASWLRTAAEVEGAVFPGIEIKSFEMDEEEAAEAWLEKI